MEESKDKSKSAEKERQIMAAHDEKEEAEKKEKSWRRKMWHRIRHGSLSSNEAQGAREKTDRKALSKPGLDVESAIPPSGKRDDS